MLQNFEEIDLTLKGKILHEIFCEAEGLTESEANLIRGTINGIKLARALYHKSKEDVKQNERGAS